MGCTSVALFYLIQSAPQLENMPWWAKIFYEGGGKRAFGDGGQKYTKYNKINNNSENFMGARLLLGVLRSPGPP